MRPESLPAPASSSPEAATPPPAVASATREERLLRFVASHDMVLAEQAAAVVAATVDEVTDVLDLLRGRGMVCRVRLRAGSPDCYAVSAAGAERVDPALPPLPPFDPRGWWRAVELGWMSVAASSGSFGDAREVLTRRQMLAADATGRSGSLLGHAGATFCDGTSAAGEPEFDLLYPDLALLLPAGGWVAVGLLIGTPDPEWVRERLGRAGRDPLIAGQVLVIVEEDDEVRDLIENTAAGLGLADRVQIRALAAAEAVAD